MQFLELEWWPNDLEGQGQWLPFSIIAERSPRCILGAILVILTPICDELSWGQAKFHKIQSQNGQNDFEGHGHWPPFSIPAENIPGCIFAVNLAILAQICDELLCRQAKFPKILSQNGQNDLEGQWPPYSIPAKSISGRMFEANCWFQLKPVMSYHVDKEKFTDGWTDRRTDGQTDGQMQAIPLRPERTRGNKAKYYHVYFIMYPVDVLTLRHLGIFLNVISF